MDGRLGRCLSPKDLGHFLLKPLKAVAPCLIPLTRLTLVLMVFWLGTVDAEKRLCRSSCVSLMLPFPLPLSHTRVSFTGSSIRLHARHTHNRRLFSLSIRSVITGQRQHLKTVVLAEPVSSLVELTIFPKPDCTTSDSFPHVCTPSRSTDRETAPQVHSET